MTIASILAFVLAGTSQPSPNPTRSPSPGRSAGTDDVPGPVAFYELVDASASRLMARPLDGRSQPREVVSRQDVDATPRWSVDGTGTYAVVLVDVPGDDAHLDLVGYATTGGAARWTLRLGSTSPALIRWSRDGRALAIEADAGPRGDERELFVVDAATGQARTAAVPDDAAIEGIDSEGAVILWQAVDDGSGDRTSIRLLRVDPVTLAVEQLRTLPDVPPTSDGSLSIAPAARAAISVASVEDQPGMEIRLRDLSTGAMRSIGRAPSVDLVSIDPAGTGAAVTGNGAVRFIQLDGRSEDVFDTDDSITDLAWSSDGRRLLISTYGPPSRLWIVEPATGRSVDLPLPEVADAHLLALVGDEPLPSGETPALPAPTPTPPPAGDDVAGIPTLLSTWLDTASGRLVARAQRLVPTEDGGVRVAADMPGIDLGPAPRPEDQTPTVTLHPRPRSDEVLVWIQSDAGARGDLWDTASGTVRALPLPPDWHAPTGEAAWRPDGGAIAAEAGVLDTEGDFTGMIAVAEIGGKRTTRVPIDGNYDRLEGWWSATELRVGHVICTEGCPGRYSFSARLRISDHRLRQLSSADRGHQAVDIVYGDDEHNQLVLAFMNEAPETDLRVDWPEAFGPVRDAAAQVAGDQRSLIVTRPDGGNTEVDRVADVIGRAVGGRVKDPNPVRIGTIDGHDLQLTFSPGEAWVVAGDRTGGFSLARLADGRRWALDRGRQYLWVPPDGGP
ncbi:MAG TPA: hypothetical protein VFI34_02135 [Candidatus Limnocylindrales bacterium]|nr:hypothetical protein [Candidatus Limnocylindrales bacterium]